MGSSSLSKFHFLCYRPLAPMHDAFAGSVDAFTWAVVVVVLVGDGDEGEFGKECCGVLFGCEVFMATLAAVRAVMEGALAADGGAFFADVELEARADVTDAAGGAVAEEGGDVFEVVAAMKAAGVVEAPGEEG